jgi:hypothetical protein
MMSRINIGTKEKRDFIRMNIDTEIKCKIRGTKEEFTGKCKNLSHTGLQFLTSKHLKEGTEIDVSLKIDSGLGRPPLNAKFIAKRISRTADEQYLVSGKLSDVK